MRRDESRWLSCTSLLTPDITLPHSLNHSITFIMLKIRRFSFLGQINHEGICDNYDISDCLDCDVLAEASGKRLKKVSPLFVVLQGGVIMVTHDERLVRSVCKEVWMCSNGLVIRQDGGFDQYRKLLEDQIREL